VALGVHPRERKASATRRLGGLLVRMVASAACALGLSQRSRPGRPSTRWRRAWRLGLPQGPTDREPRGLPPGWRPCLPAQPHPCQIMRSTVKAFTVHSESTHNAFTV